MSVRRAVPAIADTLIVGAGPAGLAVAACLRERGVPFCLVERGERPGWSWHNHYERLHLHTIKSLSALPGMPFPAHYPRYVSRQQLCEYLDAYARRFEIEPRLGETVQRSIQRGEGWETRSDRAIYRTRRLVLATGYNRTPNVPKWPGQDRFRGEVLHSSRYRSGRPFRGKRVLVVGCGNSGAEIALDLWEHGARPSLAVRGPVHVLPRDLLGVPAQAMSLTMSLLPRPLANAIVNRLQPLLRGDLDRYGLRAPDVSPIEQVERQGRIPLIDVGTIHLIRQGLLSVTPGLQAFTENGVQLEGGEERELDAVVLATGYRPALADLVEGADRVLDPRGNPQVHGRESPLRGLYFIGFRNPITGALRDIAREARQIARDIAREARHG